MISHLISAKLLFTMNDHCQGFPKTIKWKFLDKYASENDVFKLSDENALENIVSKMFAIP